MKFLIDKYGTRAINTAFVTEIYIDGGSVIARTQNYEDDDYEDDDYEDDDYEDDDYEDDDYENIELKEFDLGDAEENFLAAKKYLAALVESLNGGQS